MITNRYSNDLPLGRLLKVIKGFIYIPNNNVTGLVWGCTDSIPEVL